MRRGLVVAAALPAEMPKGLERLGVLPSLVGQGARNLPPSGLPGRGGVLVTGTCGALLEGIAPGSLVLATSVVDAEGERLPDPRLREALEQAARSAGLALRRERFVEAASLVDDDAARAELASRTGAACVDLESARIARHASREGRPWAVLRFVTDAPGARLDWLADLLGSVPREQPSLSLILRRLALRPRALPRLVRLGRLVGRGARDVRRVVESLPD